MRRATDWPFCHSRQNKLIAVVWTAPRQYADCICSDCQEEYGCEGCWACWAESAPRHRLTATKKDAEAAVRVWKTWKERHGWETRKLDSGYLAQKDGLREWCGVHVYDFNSRERIN